MRASAAGILGLLFGSLLGVSTAVKAEQDIYIGANYSIQTYENDALGESYNPTVGLMRLGVDVNNYLGFETRFGFSVTSDTQTESGSSLEITNTAMLGVYGKARMMMTHLAGVYGLLGVSYFDISQQRGINLRPDFASDSTSVSIGAGLESRVLNDWMLNAEFMFYSLQSDQSLSGIEFGAAYLF